jgi:hypothetical protein
MLLITTDYDVQASSDYLPMLVFCKFKLILPKTCPTKAMISNNHPVINAGADFTIPKGTAFVLKGQNRCYR